MKKILFINACVRPKSRTYRLAKQVLNQMEGAVEEVNLEQEKIKPLDWETLQLRDDCVSRKEFSAPLLRYARQFIEADEIVVAAPYWDFSFPATVKIYFEAVTVCGMSFAYTPEGIPKGLCKAKKLIYVTTAGGSIGGFNMGYDYIKTLSSLYYGIPETVCYKAENLDIKDADEEAIMQKAMEEIVRA